MAKASWAHIRDLAPHGGTLRTETWARRHRGIVVLLWAHAAGLGAAIFNRLEDAVPSGTREAQ